MENEKILSKLKKTIEKEGTAKRTVEAEKTIVEKTMEKGSVVAQDIQK